MTAVSAQTHTAIEDGLALLTGTLLVAVGLQFFQVCGVGSGGAPGLALLLHYGTGLGLAPALVVVNLPFYVFAYLRMGWRFTLKTFVAVSLLAAETWSLPRLMEFGRVDPSFGAAFGGLMIGVGLLILIRHKSSLGGVGIMALHLQDKRGWPAGKVQMLLDALILTALIAVLDLPHLALSLVGAVALNLVLATNHKSGRYQGC